MVAKIKGYIGKQVHKREYTKLEVMDIIYSLLDEQSLKTH